MGVTFAPQFPHFPTTHFSMSSGVTQPPNYQAFYRVLSNPKNIRLLHVSRDTGCMKYAIDYEQYLIMHRTWKLCIREDLSFSFNNKDFKILLTATASPNEMADLIVREVTKPVNYPDHQMGMKTCRYENQSKLGRLTEFFLIPDNICDESLHVRIDTWVDRRTLMKFANVKIESFNIEYHYRQQYGCRVDISESTCKVLYSPIHGPLLGGNLDEPTVRSQVMRNDQLEWLRKLIHKTAIYFQDGKHNIGFAPYSADSIVGW